jgi:hypothetical protein
VACYGKPHGPTSQLVRQWYAVFGGPALAGHPGPRARRPDGYELALVSTPAELVERYADRWSVEIVFEESRQSPGSARPATAPPARSSALSRSACCA